MEEDLNFLMFRRWSENRCVEKAQSAQSKLAHEKMAKAYDERIMRRRTSTAH